jgi:serine/threonine protein kinase
MEVRLAGGASGAESDSPGAADSVTDVGAPALVRVPSLKIERGAVLAGRYQVEAAIGKGGSGIVLRAFDRMTQVPVAIKILNPDLARDPKWLERFSRELRLARQIQHPNVCRVFDIDEADGHWFLTMELASAGTLRDSLAASEFPRRSPETRTADARAAIAGLAAIHSAQIIHRDIKPENYLRMEDGRLVLSDFGLASVRSDSTSVTIMVGTPSYMAPEVVMGEPATARSDVWSLGVVLHEIFFGRRPTWDPPSKGHSLHRERSELPSAIDRAIGDLCSACLDDDSIVRPADGREMETLFDLAIRGRRHPRRALKRRAARWFWPALAACMVAGLVGLRARLWAPAAALPASAGGQRALLRAAGTPMDWSKDSKVVASFREVLHCLSWAPDRRRLSVIVGSPRRAIDIDPATGEQTATHLPAEVVSSVGCPQISSNGRLLFENFDRQGRRQILFAQSLEDASKAQQVALGSEPVWLPNGTEFAFDVDESHAAVMSLSLMTTNLIADDLPSGNFLVQKGISEDGRLLALRYVDGSFRKHIIVHSLPSLSVLAGFMLGQEEKEFAFLDAHHLAVGLEEPGNTGLAELDLGAGVLKRLGLIGARILQKPTTSRGMLAFASMVRHADVWRVERGKPIAKLVEDGVNFNPDASSHGDVIAEHEVAGQGYLIRLYPNDGPPQSLTSGPEDYTPQFLPDGRGWLYVDGKERAIKKCSRAGVCQTVHAGDDFPFFPSMAPDSERIAYVTKIHRPRLSLLESSGEVRDLGPARPDCAPRWSGRDRLWVLRGSERSPIWTEIDANTGSETGARANPGPPRETVHDCPFMLGPPRGSAPTDVAAIYWEENDLRTLAAFWQPRER